MKDEAPKVKGAAILALFPYLRDGDTQAQK